MQAGLLRDFVDLYQSVTTVSETSGEQIRSWNLLWHGRAKVEYSSGTQLMENNETFNTITRKITIRTKPLFTQNPSDLQVRIGSDRYRILSRDVRTWDMATILIVELINQ